MEKSLKENNQVLTLDTISQSALRHYSAPLGLPQDLVRGDSVSVGLGVLLALTSSVHASPQMSRTTVSAHHNVQMYEIFVALRAAIERP